MSESPAEAHPDYNSIDFFTDQSLVPDPYPYFDHLRSQCPVLKTSNYGVYAITGYDEASVVYKDADLYSSCIAVGGPFPPLPFTPQGSDISAQIEEHRDEFLMSEHMVTMDPPQHSRARSLLNRLLTPKRLKENEDFMWPLADEVLDDFIAARELAGGKLVAAILERVDGIAAQAAQVRELIPVIRAGQRAKLEARLADLAQPADPGRLEQELVIWLQKLDVDEELDRLDSHLAELRRVLAQREPVGRRLDFLLQEFNREANTLGSKSVDARTSNAAVELKVLIDQIREQIQNIE